MPQLANNVQTSLDDASASTAAFDAGAARIERLLEEAEASVAALDGRHLAEGSRRFELPDFDDSPKAPHALRRSSGPSAAMQLEIELGRTTIERSTVDGLADGSVVLLDDAADAPLEVRVNGKLVARGELLVINDRFCIRVTERLDDSSGEDDDA
jgi:flagellar motor switch protein FliN/FliY